METYMLYVKREKKTVILLLISAMSYSIAGHFFLPFLWNSLTNGILIRWYHYVFGIAGIAGGIIGYSVTYFLWSTQAAFKESVKILGKILGLYLGAQIVLSIIAGCLSALFYDAFHMGLEAVKVLTDVVSGMLQVPVQTMALCLVIESLSSLKWRPDRQLFIKGLAAGYVCYLCGLLYSFLDNRFTGLLIKSVCSAVLFACFCIFLKVQSHKGGQSHEA